MGKALGWFVLGTALGVAVTLMVRRAAREQDLDRDVDDLSDYIARHLASMEVKAMDDVPQL